MDKNFMEVGQIVNIHGLKGYVKTVAWVDDSSNFEDFEYIFIENTKMTIEDIKFLKQNVLLKLRGIDTPEDAEKLKGKIIYCQREKIFLPKGRYFITDLIGCSVFSEEQKEIGVLKNVIPTGSNDVYEILTSDNRLIYLPVIKEVVCSIDINTKVITVKKIDGLEL